MADIDEMNTSDMGQGDTGSAPSHAADTDKPKVDIKVTNFIKSWTGRIKAAKKHYEKPFEKMEKCMQIAKSGGEKAWTADESKYVVPILIRLTNQAVAQLYARNPTAVAKRKKRRMFQVWDGTIATLTEAENTLKQVSVGLDPDPNALAIMSDAENVKKYDTMMDGLADTLTILHAHFMEDQSAQYKQLFKALVRRTKVVGVGYVKLCFQRVLEKQPDITAKIADATEQLKTLERLQAEAKETDFDQEGPDAEQSRTLLADLQSQETLIVNEGPLLAFPKPRTIIPDPATIHLKTWTGTNWIAEEFDKTPDEIMEDYGVEVDGQYTEHKPSDTESRWNRFSDEKGEATKVTTAKVWRVQNRKTGQVFTICEGYPDYLKPPAPPDVQIPRFFDLFSLVFNEIEDDDDIFPPSDIWNARHMQAEYNRSRQGLREHRQQNRPAYFAAGGSFEEKDLDKIQSHESGAVIILNQLTAGEDIKTKIMAKPVMQIVREQYDVTEIWNDVLRTTGEQQANAGPTTTSTATESSIAEQSRTVQVSDNVDDLDDLLTLLAQSTGIVMLKMLSKSTVMEIVGPGAVWPDLPQTREELVEDILLETRAGSSGRPNAAAELQKLQMAMPNILQLPNINPIPITQKYLDLLDIDVEDAVVEGLPSTQALNAAMAKAGAQPSTGDPQTDPAAQGPAGGQNAPQAPGTTPGPQPAYPAPAPGGQMAGRS